MGASTITMPHVLKKNHEVALSSSHLGLIGLFLTSTYIWRGLAPLCYNLEYYLSDSWKWAIESLPAGRKRKDGIIGVLKFDSERARQANKYMTRGSWKNQFQSVVFINRTWIYCNSTGVHDIKQITIPNEMANEEAPISLDREVH